MGDVERATNGRWLPGQSANPLGRPRGTGSGVILSEHVKRDTLEEWQRRGKAALEDLTSWQFVQWCGTILPKELLLAATVESNPV
jgi:hypothetical protein